ncbi:hypothetical protein KKF92_00220 [Patescibacteria group bacterium]|nr:hypothetical protein [Patescibacteria group bacterium]
MSIINKNFISSNLVRNLFMIIGVAAVGLASTQALFRDVEQSQQGVFVVGTLDMSVEEPNGQVAESIVVNNVGESSNIQGGKTWVVRNVGSLPGRLNFGVDNIRNIENGCNEPEALVDVTCSSPGVGEGELGQNIQTQVTLTKNNTATQVILATLATDQAGVYKEQWIANVSNRKIPPGGSVEVTFAWQTDNYAFGNEVQSDSVMFDVVYELEQITGGV